MGRFLDSNSMGCGASKDVRQAVPPKAEQPQAPPDKIGEPVSAPNHSLPSHPGMLKQPTGAAASSTTTSTTTAGAAHPASLSLAHPASLSSAAEIVGKQKKKGQQRKASVVGRVMNKAGHSTVGQVIGNARYNMVESAPLSSPCRSAPLPLR